MKITSKLFKGIDASLEESLLSYGVLVSINPTKENEYCIVYRTQVGEDSKCNEFDVAYMSLEELIGKTKEEWFDRKAFLAYINDDYKIWINTSSMAQKVSDMISYYSYADIFGISYDPLTAEQTIKFINHYKDGES